MEEAFPAAIVRTATAETWLMRRIRRTNESHLAVAASPGGARYQAALSITRGLATVGLVRGACRRSVTDGSSSELLRQPDD